MVRLVSDENIHGDVVSGLRLHFSEVEIVRVQEVGLLGIDDPTILEWAATQGRIVLTGDRNTMIGDAYTRVTSGKRMPGVMVLRKGLTFAQAIEAVAIAALASDPSDWIDRVHFLPL
jgi:predicted nuclease of predicted toxin-antitoxin system